MSEAKFVIISQTEIEMHLSDGEQSIDFVRLAVSDIDGLIAQLAQFRRNMMPEVSRVLPVGQHPPGPIDPLWMVQDFPLLEGKLLFVRHEGLGWQLFQFPPAEAAKLGNALLAQRTAESLGPPNSTDLLH